MSIRNNNQHLKQKLSATVMKSQMERLEPMKSEVKLGEKRKREF